MSRAERIQQSQTVQTGHAALRRTICAASATVWLVLAGCQPAAPADEPTDEETQQANPENIRGLGEGQTGPDGPTIVDGDGNDEPEQAVPADLVHRVTGHAPVELSATDVVANALFDAEHGTAEHVEALLRNGVTRTGEPAEGRLIRFMFTSNLHAELEDCGCRRHPLGGLARRATMLADAAEGADAIVHLDAGDSLFRQAEPGQNIADPNHNQATMNAAAMSDVFDVVTLDAFALGQMDLAYGADFIDMLGERGDVPFLSANLMHDGELLVPASTTVDAAGYMIGVTAVTSPDHTSLFWGSVGLEAEPALDAATREITALRAEGSGMVVLLSTLGLNGSEVLISELVAANAAPDLVLVSGTNRLMHEPRFVDGVPMLEGGVQGKNFVQLDAHIIGDSVSFAPESGEALTVIGEYRTLLRMAQVAQVNLRGIDLEGPRANQATHYQRNLQTYGARLDELRARFPEFATELSGGASDEGSGSYLEVEVIEVGMDIVQDERVRTLLDETYERMEADGHTVDRRNADVDPSTH